MAWEASDVCLTAKTTSPICYPQSNIRPCCTQNPALRLSCAHERLFALIRVSLSSLPRVKTTSSFLCKSDSPPLAHARGRFIMACVFLDVYGAATEQATGHTLRVGTAVPGVNSGGFHARVRRSSLGRGVVAQHWLLRENCETVCLVMWCRTQRDWLAHCRFSEMPGYIKDLAPMSASMLHGIR